MSDQDLDKMFKEGLDQSFEHAGKDAAWSKLNRRLMNDGNPRRFTFWLFLVIPLILLGSSYFFSFSQTNDEVISSIKNYDQKSTKEDQSQIQKILPIETESKKTELIHRSADNLVKTPSLESKKKNQKTSAIIETGQTKNSDIKFLSKTNDIKTNNHSSKEEKIPKNTFGQTSSYHERKLNHHLTKSYDDFKKQNEKKKYSIGIHS